MLFINEANTSKTGMVYVPDILSAVQDEYATYQCTINDQDLLFIMTYLQEKLDNLMDRMQLEDLFCYGLLTKLKEDTLQRESYIICDGHGYLIDEVIKQSDGQVNITLKSKDSDKTWGEWLKEKVHYSEKGTHHLKIEGRHVKLDDTDIAFPNDMLLVSSFDVCEVWYQLEHSVLKQGRIPNDKVLEKEVDALLISCCIDEHFRGDLITFLRQARAAQDIPYDVFSFHPPSQWVEQFILYAVRKQYEDNDPNFVKSVQESITGLSRCVDKTIYFNFFSEFLEDSPLKNDYGSGEILDTLQVMKSMFIDYQLCTLVTQQGIAQAWPQDSAEEILSELEESGLIDDIGAFLPDVTPDAIQSYCKMYCRTPRYLNIVYTMQRYSRDLLGKELLFWNHKMHELSLRLDLQDKVDGEIDEDTCEKVIMYAQQLVRQYGNLTVSKFMLALKKKEKLAASSLLELVEKCAHKEWIFDDVITELKVSDPLAEILNRLQTCDWEEIRRKQHSTEEIIASIKKQLTPGTVHLLAKLDAIVTKVNNIKVLERERKHSQLKYGPETSIKQLVLTPICNYTEQDIKKWATAFRKSTFNREQPPLEDPLFSEAFAVIRRGVSLVYEKKGIKGVTPRDTQMVASLMFFQNLSVQEGASQGTRLMQQISTGEGKTMIICMTAIFKALRGEKVDIVTSSSVLATRDAAEQKDFYDLFNVSVSHSCHEEPSKRQQAYESDVIYGEIGSFQRDILETDFYGRAIRTSHGFDNVIIDEVDSMLVDKGETMLYLPHALPDLNILDNVYLEIWSLVNAQDFIGFPDEQDGLHKYLKCKIFGGLQVNAFTTIPEITVEQSADIHGRCVDIGLINQDDNCVKTNNRTAIQGQITTLDAVPTHLKQEVMLVFQQHMEITSLINTIPEPLHHFVKKSLKSWIQSAVNAKYFRPNREYIIDIDRRESAADRYPKIIIMDNETGVEQESSEWGSGLHQFLQLKHYLRLSTESLKAVYMSNISFFTPRYSNIMGVTGTLGSNAEHSLFNKLYKDTQLIVLPTNKPSRIQIEVTVCCSNKESWETAIHEDVIEKCHQKRAVLLICEDVERSKYLHRYFKDREPDLKPELYISSHQKKLEVSGDCQPKRLIIATNLAGRGTDLTLSDTVRHHGGLHVCLSYLPPNIRIELQAYGRAARSGDPGSCKLIFHDEQGDLSYAIRKRDLSEARRVAGIEADYFHNIKFQEELFERFKAEYNKVKDKHNGKPEGRPELDYCLDCWAYFLDLYTDAIEAIPNKSDREIQCEKVRLRRAFDREIKDEIVRMTLSPARLMQLGHVHMKRAVKQGKKYKDAGNIIDYEKSKAVYQKAMALNPGDPFAKYYAAVAQLNYVFYSKNTTFDSGKSSRRDLKQIFYKLIPLFQTKLKQCQSHISILQLANRHQDQSLTAHTQYFDEQKQHEMEVYNQVIETMQNIIGKEITSKTFDHADWGEKGAVIVFEMVKRIFLLKEHRVSPHYQSRLKALLDTETSYHTYQSKITERIQSLMPSKLATNEYFKGESPMPSKPVTEEDFRGIFPEKHHFWNQLKKHNLITHVKDDKRTEKQDWVGYWNPTIDTKCIQFESWDCISADTFVWIGMSLAQDLVHHLTEKHVLNQKGQLIDLDLSKPLHLPEVFTPHYNQIKDTLWIHSIYQFVLNHLHDCTIIDTTCDIDDTSSTITAPPDQVPTSEAILQTSSYSVVDIITSINVAANTSSTLDIQHIQVPSDGKPTPLSLAVNSDTMLFSMADHYPTEEMNQAFFEQLWKKYLRTTKVSGEGLNCMINALLQHAKQDYHTPAFRKEADTIRDRLQEQYPHPLDVTGMLHCDDQHAEAILRLVNDACGSTIRTVSVVIASVDGPIIYGGTHDKRLSMGRNVVIWQQGNHYVSIIHHNELVQATLQVTCPDVQNVSHTAVPKLTQSQLRQLEGMDIVKKMGESKYNICTGLDNIKHALKSMKSEQDQDHTLEFLHLKLEIDFKTLNNSPRQLASDQHCILYDDLCRYAVIKPVKLRRKAEDIKQHSQHVFGYRGRVFVQKPYFSVPVLNSYLKQKEIEEVNKSQQSDLLDSLQNRLISSYSNEIFEFMVNGVLQREVDRMPCHRVLMNLKDDELKLDKLLLETSLSKSQQSGVKDYLRLTIQLQENVDTIISTMKDQQSTILELDTPEITLRKLSDVFDESIQEKGDVVGWFSDSQCDFIIDLAEQKWSWKSITTAIGAIARGVAQIALGAVLLVATVGTGSFLCSTLISEGVSDMIFGIEGLVKGHCNWSQYWDNKKMSLAITIATAGVGALLARGKEASKYVYKAFGNASKELAIATAKETGKKFTKEIAKQVAKKIGKDVVGAIADAGINLAIDAIMDQLLQAIGTMSKRIIDCFDSMCQDKELHEKMNYYLRHQNPDKAEKYLHQIAKQIIFQKGRFLRMWDGIEDKVQKVTDIATGAHGQATKHLEMCGEKLRGGQLMKGIGYISRFGPLLSEAMKGYSIIVKMEGVKADLKQSLEVSSEIKHGQTPLNDAAIGRIRKELIEAMKQQFSEEMSQRGQNIIKTGLKIVSKQIKKRTIKYGKGGYHSIRGHIDMNRLTNYEQKLEAAKSSKSLSRVKKYETKLQQLMTRSRNPEVFARMIKHHDALLGPAFAVPALEKLTNRPIIIVSEDKETLLNLEEQHGKGNSITIKFVPAKDDQQGYFYYGEQIYSPRQHGNNSLIHAVMAGAGRTCTDADAVKYRNEIAKACVDPEHPCYDYIKRGIARNYVQIGLVGGGVKFQNEKFSGKSEWYPHMDQFLLADWKNNNQKTPSKVDISMWNAHYTELSLAKLKLRRCHRLLEKSIQEVIQRCIQSSDKTNLILLRDRLLPTIKDVQGEKSLVGEKNQAFLQVYDDPKDITYRQKYEEQIGRVNAIITKWGTSTGPSDYVQLAKDFNNSPINVSLGNSRTNAYIGKRMDYNPGSPRSERLFEKFSIKPVLHPPVITPTVH